MIRACGGKGFGVFSTAVPDPGSNDGNSPLLSPSPELTRLIRALRRCGAGVAMVVPLDLAITPMRVLQDPLVGPRCRALFEEGGVDDRLLVMLFLMAERRRPGSLWKPYDRNLQPNSPCPPHTEIILTVAEVVGHCNRRYLDMLPSTFGSSLWFTEEELAELEGTTLHRATVIQVHHCCC